MSASPDILIALLRHGQTEGGAGFRGSTDDLLTPMGWEQMNVAVGAMPWDHIVASPLRRCADFARELAARLAVPLDFDERLREMHFGAWEGCSAAELMESDGAALTRFWRNPASYTPPAGEALGDFQARVLAAWDDLRGTPRGGRVLVVCHGGVIRTILCVVLGHPLERLMELPVDVDHGSLHGVRLDGGGRAELHAEERG